MERKAGRNRTTTTRKLPKIMGISPPSSPLLLLFLLIVHQISAHSVRKYRVKATRTRQTAAAEDQQQPRRVARACTAHSDPQLHILMDQICELCHEMFSHVQPNLRANCSERCYKNEQFRKCLRMFSALPPGHPGGMAFTELLMRMDDGDPPEEEAANEVGKRRRKHRRQSE